MVFLGSYARADRVKPRVPAGQKDEDYTEAQEWLATLRATGRDDA